MRTCVRVYVEQVPLPEGVEAQLAAALDAAYLGNGTAECGLIDKLIQDMEENAGFFSDPERDQFSLKGGLEYVLQCGEEDKGRRGR